MAVRYNKLWKMMIDKKMTRTELTHLSGISTNAMARLVRDEDVWLNIPDKSVRHWIVVLKRLQILFLTFLLKNVRMHRSFCRGMVI